MVSVPPVAIAIIIASSVAFIGAFVAYFRDKRKYAGHEDYTKDAETLKKKLDGELFRDGDDLVVSGSFKKLPTVIRFSYSDHTPGMNIRVGAPASFAMSIVPKGARSTEGRVLVRTSDDLIDARFATRSDDPAHARMFFGSRGVIAELQKLCGSSKTFITFTRGAIEISELAIPSFPGEHILAHLESLSRLSEQLKKLPGSDQVKVKPIRRERHLLLRTAIAVGIVAAVASVIAANQPPREAPVSVAADDAIPSGIPPIDADRITGLSKWKLAGEADFDADAAGWLNSLGMKPSGRVEASFIDAPARNSVIHDAAYLLRNDQNQRRVVMLANGVVRFDANFPYVLLLARVPKSSISRIEWAGRAPQEPDGDAILIVRKPQDRASGLVVFLSGGQIVAGVPADYQTVPLLD